MAEDSRKISLPEGVVAQDLDSTGSQEVLLGIFGERTVSTGDLSRGARRKRLREIFGILRKYDVVKGLTPQKFVSMLEDLGPTFVKAGQILSMRSEILPEPFCKELEKLRTDVEPMTYDTVLEVLEHEYKKPVAELFEVIDEKPLGSASIAQVHRARLTTGQDVAIKVQRPRVREVMGQDIEIMRMVVRHLSPFMGGDQFVDLKSVVSELWDSFNEETDFLVEAKNLQEYRSNNAEIRYVTAPKPYPELCTQHVLVMDYIDGISISDPRAIVAAGYDLTEIGTKLVDNYAKQVLDDGFFHADPHPGNVMVAHKKIVFIDWGMAGHLSSYYRSILRSMLLAVASHDSASLERGLIELSENHSLDIDHAALLAELDNILDTYGTMDLSDLDLGAFLSDLIGLARRYAIELPGAMTMIARGLVTLEGVIDEFLPGVSMIEIIEHHLKDTQDVQQMAAEELKELALQSRKALHGTLEALSQAGLVTDMLTRGELKMNLDFSGSQDPIEDLSHIADRLTMGIIIAGLLIGSSIVYFAGASFTIMGVPLLGFLGYLLAIGLSIYMVRDILKHDKKRRK
ncbi:MAG: AarF/ABC1/UbiB kinase family protein [Atopobiaceae bacterium]|jgi:ubiquinone biosynthesis protein|uniref:AarF/ABC1/UbiB kinase family protein n=1 Tax=Muricaecibacterium torontonense TaxID=3032871 RepID=A0A4S2EXR0_9ACTN|nr:AarF/UbiB family protein [Muricaecibacterium torontonense]MCI8675899.1 AarF/ABC1/UbiB kinase family protein [Atopobiaceae bacterium]TGY61279.1 AarF/ABC1/UbiB kinase family protein [Muricaecibacterium torontonense]